MVTIGGYGPEEASEPKLVEVMRSRSLGGRYFGVGTWPRSSALSRSRCQNTSRDDGPCRSRYGRRSNFRSETRQQIETGT